MIIFSYLIFISKMLKNYEFKNILNYYLKKILKINKKI